MRIQRLSTVVLACSLAGTVTWAQVGRGGSEWLTAQADAQRTSWIRTDAAISLASMSKPGFALQWTSKLNNQPRQLNGLSQGVTANGVTLFVPMSLVAGSSNNVYAIDNDTGYIVWQRRFDAALPAATTACAGGITGAATRIVSMAPPAPGAGRGGRGRAGAVGYRSLLGEPGQGVPVEARGGGAGRAAAPPVGDPASAPGAGRGAAAVAAGAAQAPAGQPGRPGGPGGGGGGRGNPANAGIPGAADGGGPGTGNARPSGVVYAVSSDGMLRVLGLQSGKDLQKPAPFLPANAQWSDAVAVGAMLYASTRQGCGAASGVWGIDLDSAAKPVVSWKSNGGSLVGSVAFTTDGTLIAVVGPGQAAAGGYANAVVALDAKTLQLKDWYTQPTTELATGPTVFHHNNREIVTVATKDGRVLLLDAASLGGANHATPMSTSQPLTVAGGTIAAEAALSTWQQMTVTPAAAAAGVPAAAPVVTLGTRFVLVPIAGRLAASAQTTNGAVTTGVVQALRLVDTGGTLSLEPAWTSANLATPATPIIVNGVVFALATGRPATAAGRGTPAVLHAYDGATGKALWNSGKSMTSFASGRSFWAAMGQAYIGTHDGTLYAFGFLDERR